MKYLRESRRILERHDDLRSTADGIPGTIFRWHGEWSDPEIEYNGNLYNYWDFKDFAWTCFKEYATEANIEPTDKNFDKWYSEEKNGLWDSYYYDIIPDSKVEESLNESADLSYDDIIPGIKVLADWIRPEIKYNGKYYSFYDFSDCLYNTYEQETGEKAFYDDENHNINPDFVEWEKDNAKYVFKNWVANANPIKNYFEEELSENDDDEIEDDMPIKKHGRHVGGIAHL